MEAAASPKPRTDIDAVRERYATRIKARLGEPSIDVKAARDGMLDCYVATYFGGLQHGIKGYLGMDAKEEQVAQVAQALFKKRLRAHGSSFEAPTVAALDRVKQEVDQELHFEELPGELRGLHDQVCSLMLSKADGALEHRGDRSVVRDASSAPTEAVPSQAKQRSARTTDVHGGLRDSLAAYLRETADGVDSFSAEQLHTRLKKVGRLVAVIEDFES